MRKDSKSPESMTRANRIALAVRCARLPGLERQVLRKRLIQDKSSVAESPRQPERRAG